MKERIVKVVKPDRVSFTSLSMIEDLSDYDRYVEDQIRAGEMPKSRKEWIGVRSLTLDEFEKLLTEVESSEDVEQNPRQ